MYKREAPVHRLAHFRSIRTHIPQDQVLKTLLMAQQNTQIEASLDTQQNINAHNFYAFLSISSCEPDFY